MDRDDLVKYLNTLLSSKKINDYCENGLQISGKKKILKIVTGVTASLELIQKAKEHSADAIIVHHGYFWKNEKYAIVGLKYNRISAIIKNDINLIAYHLPLDFHKVYGNNIQLANLLSIKNTKKFETGTELPLGLIGSLEKKQNINDFVNYISSKLDRKVLHINSGKEAVQKIAICTGAAQDFIEKAYESGADVYISGEISERTTHLARELGIHYISAGHHATERYGVRALGEHLQEKFGIETFFIDIDNPV